ncbi:MAG: hypothetical protein KAH84_10370 [Thiomargarita sp.]|nr:hypothetical protein [Thiomargarita sp.]
MKKTTLTKEIVQNAINTIVKDGFYPSIDRIRNITSGSKQRISQIRKELDSEKNILKPDEKIPKKNGASSTRNTFQHQELMLRMETRMAKMELLFTKQFADIDARLSIKESVEKNNIIKSLNDQLKQLEIKNALLVKQWNKEIEQVKKLTHALKQAKNKITNLEKINLASSPIKQIDINDFDTIQIVLTQFKAFANAQWGEEQNTEIALQKAVRQYLIEKWQEDAALLNNAVLDSKINAKYYIVVSISQTDKHYIVHCLILEINTEQLTSQREIYSDSKKAYEKVHQWLNQE